MQKVIRIGVLTPSSNTALEPLTNAILSGLPNVHAHFARFRVTNISLSDQALGQFDDSNILAAAEMLADAKPDVITWSGTSAGWMGFEKDILLCERITARTGIPASTAVLALNELLTLKHIKRLGIVSPYTEDVQQKIVRQYASANIEVVGEVHHDISVNYDFALVDTVSQAQPEAIVTYCTNLRAAQLADHFEQKSQVVLLDTVSTTVWGALRKVGVDPSEIKGWGKLFSWT